MLNIIFSISLSPTFNLFNMKYITHKPTLRDITIWFVVLVILVLGPVSIGLYLEPGNPALLIAIFFILGFFMVNLVLRRSLSLKRYFTSPFNLLTSKVCSEKLFDIPKALMFEKIVEVINHSKFRLIEADQEKFEILAITNISWISWGENLYISFETVGDETKMKFCSVTFFQITSWGKNEKNYEDLFNEIESSLTV